MASDAQAGQCRGSPSAWQGLTASDCCSLASPLSRLCCAARRRQLSGVGDGIVLGFELLTTSEAEQVGLVAKIESELSLSASAWADGLTQVLTPLGGGITFDPSGFTFEPLVNKGCWRCAGACSGCSTTLHHTVGGPADLAGCMHCPQDMEYDCALPGAACNPQASSGVKACCNYGMHHYQARARGTTVGTTCHAGLGKERQHCHRSNAFVSCLCCVQGRMMIDLSCLKTEAGSYTCGCNTRDPAANCWDAVDRWCFCRGDAQ